MGIYLRVSDQALLDTITNMRGAQDTITSKTLLSLCSDAHSIHYHLGEPIGLLFKTDEAREGLRLIGTDIPCFGEMYNLFTPNRRTTKGRELADILDQLAHSAKVAKYALSMIGPRIRSKLSIEEFGFDYAAQARIHFIGGQIFIAIIGVSLISKVYDTGSGVELITRDEYRAAVKQAQYAVSNLLFNEHDSLVIRTKSALDPFIQLDIRIVNSLLSDVYQRVITEPCDIKHYIPQLLLDRELVYLFTTIVGILHAFHGIE